MNRIVPSDNRVAGTGVRSPSWCKKIWMVPLAPGVVRRLKRGRERPNPAPKRMNCLDEWLHERLLPVSYNTSANPRFMCRKNNPPATNVATANAVIIPISSGRGHRPESSNWR